MPAATQAAPATCTPSSSPWRSWRRPARGPSSPRRSGGGCSSPTPPSRRRTSRAGRTRTRTWRACRRRTAARRAPRPTTTPGSPTTPTRTRPPPRRTGPRRAPRSGTSSSASSTATAAWGTRCPSSRPAASRATGWHSSAAGEIRAMPWRRRWRWLTVTCTSRWLRMWSTTEARRPSFAWTPAGRRSTVPMSGTRERCWAASTKMRRTRGGRPSR
mmetsp:Transcript_103203/g.301000  ORF Transcript_103203/g.301000 Transcript_103203/m.301000 type:complete len:215 (-) Transcript_103203:1040-1684(-)